MGVSFYKFSAYFSGYSKGRRSALSLSGGFRFFIAFTVLLLAFPVHAANQIPKILNYQARVTDSGGVPVSTGTINIWISAYDASSGGSCLYAMRGSCGTPSYKNVPITNGVFSLLIGDMAAGDNEIPESLFDNNSVYLGVTVASDTEMVPRKRVTAAPYALNSDKLDDLDASSSGSSTPYIVATTTNGNLTITGDPQGASVGNGSLYINPAAATASETILGIADNGSVRYLIDKEGDITHTGSLLATSASSTSQFIFRGATSASVNIFEVQDSFTNRLFSVSATSTRFINRLLAPAHANNQGLQIPTNAGVPAAVTGSSEGDVVWDSSNDNLYVYTGAAFTALANATTFNLNHAYLNSTSTAEISLSPSIGAVTIADTFSGTGNIFEVQDRTNATGDYSRRYLTVSSTSTTITSKTENRSSGYVVSVTATDADALGSASGTDILLLQTGNTGVSTNRSRFIMMNGLGTGATDSVNAIQLNTTSASTEQFHVTAAGSIYGAGNATFGDGTSLDQTTFNSGIEHAHALALYANNVYDGTAQYISVNGLYSGVGLHVASTSGNLYAGSLIRTDSSGTGELSVNGLVSLNATGNYTSANNIGILNIAATATRTGTLFSLAGNAMTNGVVMSASATSLDTGTLLKLSAGSSGSRANAIAVAQGAGNLFTVSATGTVTATLPTADNYAVCHAETNGAVTNALLTDCAGSASADYMEMYPTDGSLEMGDIVMPGATYVSGSSSGLVPRIIKTDGAYAFATIGVVSNPNEAGDFNSIGHEFSDAEHPLPVALKGRVKVKVNMENGSIKAGDPVTSSSTAGVGMKSTKPGMIVGQALEAWNGPGQGTILVFMGSGWHAGLSIGNDGYVTTMEDTLALKPQSRASSTITAYDSFRVDFRGSVWNSASATDQIEQISVLNRVSSPGEYKLLFENTQGDTLMTLSATGDVAIAGRLSLADRGMYQTSKYIYYDGSPGPGGDMMRTNASGWSVGSYDFAEMFPAVTDLEAGDLVIADTDPRNKEGVKKSGATYENALLGVISTKPGFLAGENRAEDKPVALAGRVPTKVNAENGPIAIGDPITSSSIPGVGMKATSAGRVVGIALEAYDGKEAARITVFVNPSWYSGPAPVTNEVSLAINQESLVDLQNSTLSDVSAIVSHSGLWSVTADGFLTAQNIEAKTVRVEEVVLVQSASQAVTAEGKIPVGYTAVVVQNPTMKQNSKVFVSFLDDPRGGFWIAEKGEGNFTVHVAQPAANDLPFEYWIMGIDDRRPLPSADPVEAVISSEPPSVPPPTESGSGTPETGSESGTSPVESASGTPPIS